MASGLDLPEIPRQLVLMKEREDRNRRLMGATVVTIVGVALTIWGAMMIDQYFDDYGQYQVDELPDLTIGMLLTIFGTITTTVAVVYLMFVFRA